LLKYKYSVVDFDTELFVSDLNGMPKLFGWTQSVLWNFACHLTDEEYGKKNDDTDVKQPNRDHV
jgi:hypothetical protein